MFENLTDKLQHVFDGLARQGKLSEVAELRSVEQDRQATLQRFRREERETLTRLEELEAAMEAASD